MARAASFPCRDNYIPLRAFCESLLKA